MGQWCCWIVAFFVLLGHLLLAPIPRRSTLERHDVANVRMVSKAVFQWPSNDIQQPSSLNGKWQLLKTSKQPTRPNQTRTKQEPANAMHPSSQKRKERRQCNSNVHQQVPPNSQLNCPLLVMQPLRSNLFLILYDVAFCRIPKIEKKVVHVRNAMIPHKIGKSEKV